MAYKILIVDDEKLIVKGIKYSLEQDGMDVDVAFDGNVACNMTDESNYDLIILDLMLPNKNGFEVCKYVRSKNNTPIIMLTAKNDDMDKILGLEFGADDYLTKPFNILELKGRVKAILRRSTIPKIEKRETSKIIEAGHIKINTMLKRVYVLKVEVNLTLIEYKILELLIKNRDKIYAREDLYNLIWGNNSNDTRKVDVHVRRLREKIEKKPSEPEYIKTKWGVGYYFD